MMADARVGEAAIPRTISDEHPTRGLRIVAVFGRSVTFVLQGLRGVYGEAFDAWYEPRQAELAADPVAGFFKNLRNEVLKEGGPLGQMWGVGEPITGDPPADEEQPMTWYLSGALGEPSESGTIYRRGVHELAAHYLDSLEELVDAAEEWTITQAPAAADPSASRVQADIATRARIVPQETSPRTREGAGQQD